VGEEDAGVALPLAVAVFKVTAPSTAMLVGLAMAWMAGVPVAPLHLALAVPVSRLSTFAVLGMPGAVSFVAATTPAALVMGAPLELLPVLLAVDTIPDIARTVANVTADLAVTVIAGRRG
jgi:Na+/H+-dicarboxylate symporter